MSLVCEMKGPALRHHLPASVSPHLPVVPSDNGIRQVIDDLVKAYHVTKSANQHFHHALYPSRLSPQCRFPQ